MFWAPNLSLIEFLYRFEWMNSYFEIWWCIPWTINDFSCMVYNEINSCNSPVECYGCKLEMCVHFFVYFMTVCSVCMFIYERAFIFMNAHLWYVLGEGTLWCQHLMLWYLNGFCCEYPDTILLKRYNVSCLYKVCRWNEYVTMRCNCN